MSGPSIGRLPQGCPLCQSSLQDSRELPCGNVACARCLLGQIRDRQDGGRFPCPTCKEKHEVPPGDLRLGGSGFDYYFPPAESEPSSTSSTLPTLRTLILKGAGSVVGVTTALDHLFVVRLLSKRVWVYRQGTAEFVKFVAVPGLQKPAECGCLVKLEQEDSQSPDMDLCVADADGMSLHIIRLASDPEWRLDQHRIVDLEYEPRGMTVTKEHPSRILVTAENSRTMWVYDHTGTQLSTMTLSQSGPCYGLPWSAMLAPLEEGESSVGQKYIVADYEGDKVLWVDAYGKEIRRYSTLADRQPMKHPMSLAMDREGRRLYVGYQHGVQCLDARGGRFLRQMACGGEDDGVTNPWCLHVGGGEENGRDVLYVGDGHGLSAIDIDGESD